MLLFYFSAFLIRPFFTRHWESLSGLDDRAIAGLVFAIPGVVAVMALWLGRRPSGGAGRERVVMAVVGGLLGCLLQSSSDEILVLTGRGLFGWALFHGFVRLDLLLFERSAPESYAMDFSKINVSQQLGVLLSSFAAGSLVGAHGLRAPFYAAAAGFLLTAVLSHLLLRTDAPSTIHRLQAPS
jgi:MFS transporter, DHA1 family, multidrug resistance protein